MQIGRNFAIIITMVTTVVMCFQFLSESVIGFSAIIKNIPFIFVFALTNSFVEESITRFGVVVSLKGEIRDRSIPFVSAAIFGIIHYWGSPGGIIGVLLAFFLGWFLTKSILEIKGIYWAWLIHFLQDVIIFSVTLN